MNDSEIGRGLTFGARMWMPGINIEGSTYSVGYEDVTEEHRAGIPVRLDGELNWIIPAHIRNFDISKQRF